MGKRPITGAIVPAHHDRSQNVDFARDAIKHELEMVRHQRMRKKNGFTSHFSDEFLDDKERSLYEALAALDAEESVAE